MSDTTMQLFGPWYVASLEAKINQLIEARIKEMSYTQLLHERNVRAENTIQDLSQQLGIVRENANMLARKVQEAQETSKELCRQLEKRDTRSAELIRENAVLQVQHDALYATTMAGPRCVRKARVLS